MIVGLSGFARAGKDEAAMVLVEEYGFKQIAFADKLREFVYALNPIVNTHWAAIGHEPFEKVETYLQDVIGPNGEYTWENYKESAYGPEIRRLLQRLGTEAGRQTMWDTIWIDSALRDVGPSDNVVVSDARFFNEFDAITDRGGEIWRIERDGVGPQSDHASEMEAIHYHNFTYRIFNDGSLESYRDSVRACAEVTLERV